MPPVKRSPNVPQRTDVQPSDLTFPVVGIGASAGGFQAIKTFFEHMPKDNGMAFVIVLHLSPEHQSIADKIIQESTKMQVLQVTKPVPIERNTVYVISPAHDLQMSDGYLRVASPEPRRGGHVAIDLFFRDLADVHKERAFCVVLSGTGSDGAVGVSRIKEQGGVTLAQAPDDAEYDSMPRAAIDTGLVDLVMPVAEMPQKLLELWNNSRKIRLPTANDPEIHTIAPQSDQEAMDSERLLSKILAQLRAGSGYDFKHYKRATVLRRIERRMQVTSQNTLLGYSEYLQAHPKENKALLGDMLIGVTNFFRDREAFEALERDILPQLVKPDSSSKSTNEVRVWSAGCSTGEEAYSLAMLVNDQIQVESSSSKLQVFATDIDERAISAGRLGSYPEAIITDVPPPRLRQYFIKENQHYRIRKELRERVLFAQHSLLSDPPFSKIDLIVCRNLLIYLDREVQREILEMFHFALRPGGFLFLGTSESADICTDLFAPVDKKNRIYRALSGASAPRRTPTISRLGSFRATQETQTLPPVRSKRKAFADIHLRAIAHSAPPSIVVDRQGDILHTTDHAVRFLRYVSGEVSHSLVTLIEPSLRLEARTALFQAIQSGKVVKSGLIEVSHGNENSSLRLEIRPYDDEESGEQVFLVMFIESEIAASRSGDHPSDSTENHVLVNLEGELHRTKLQLQETIEHSEISEEELKAANEEMQAVNEELRSATEELETSKEELQSINEELMTVNHELKTKVDETDKVNDYLTNLIASTDIATVFVDRSLRIKWFTPAATEIFSMLPVDTGRSLLDITHRLNYEDLSQDASSVFESLTVIEREVSSADGRCFIARLLPYRSNEDHIDGTVLTFIDITKRRSTEEELRLSEERMRLVAESALDYAIIVQDDAGVVTSWNKGAEMIFGYSKQEAEGKYFDFLFSSEDKSSGIPEWELKEAQKNGSADDERWMVRKGGERFFCSGKVSVLKGQNFQGFVKLARDLTGQKRQQEIQLKRINDTENSSHLKDEFFAVMSHELKHPLNLIQLKTEILRRLPIVKTTASANEAVSCIREAVASQARIIDDLLDVARVRTGKLKLKRVPVDLGKVLTEIHKVVVSDNPNKFIELSLPDAENYLIVDADPTRLEQVVWNLVNNAVKFTPESGTISIIGQKACDEVILAVADSGIGIAADHLDKVFDLFRQAEHHHMSHQREGLGIGLSLVRQLVEAHGGNVEVNSGGLGKGCTFTVRLPLMHNELPPSENDLQLPEGLLAGVRILLVDDSPEVLETLKLLLEMELAQVQAFSSPEKALRAAEDSEYDLIISDIGMPEMNGHELMQALRQLPHCKTVPSIALTGYGAGQDVQRSIQSGFTTHLGKPVDMDVLLETTRAIMPS
ncbi:CheR family methyltransferase [Pseudomonas yamanorum]|uniref:CheR family methyltransferase n=1 Tax=Pseudomonas yamanorum TaxID=515393 RepID=UPI003D3664C1